MCIHKIDKYSLPKVRRPMYKYVAKQITQSLLTGQGQDKIPWGCRLNLGFMSDISCSNHCLPFDTGFAPKSAKVKDIVHLTTLFLHCFYIVSTPARF